MFTYWILLYELGTDLLGENMALRSVRANYRYISIISTLNFQWLKISYHLGIIFHSFQDIFLLAFRQVVGNKAERKFIVENF